MEFIAPTDGPYVVLEGKKLLDFSSCDFLGLAQHPEVKKGAIKYALKYGVAAHPFSTPQREVESKLAHYLGKESALLFSCTALLRTELEQAGAMVVSTEEGNLATLKKANGLKVADDTHLFGMAEGNGFRSFSEISHIDAICGTLLGGAATFIAGGKKQLAAFRQHAVSFPTLGALDSALSFIPEMDAERKAISKRKVWLTKTLKNIRDADIEELVSPRVAVRCEGADDLRQFFLKEQIFVAPAKDQTLYFSITALHTPDDLDQLSDALKKLATTDRALAMQSLTLTPSK